MTKIKLKMAQFIAMHHSKKFSHRIREEKTEDGKITKVFCIDCKAKPFFIAQNGSAKL